MLFAKSKKYDQNFVRDNMMGPNALKIIGRIDADNEAAAGDACS